jgi:hypothetical protein
LLGHCSPHLCKSFAGANMVYSWAESVFILEYYLKSKLFAAVYEAFSNVYPDKEVLSKMTIYWLITTFWDTESVCLCISAGRVTKQLTLWLYWFKAVYQLQQWDTAARIWYYHWFHCFMCEGLHV